MINETKIVVRDEALEQLDELQRELLHKMAEEIKERAKEMAPVDTGELRDSIEILDEDMQEKKAYIGTECGYGLYVELGTSKTSSQPFLRPALDETIVKGEV